ncbi:MAG: tetratricopeptide repeat protein [Candidatus Omnitrophota bacterium]
MSSVPSRFLQKISLLTVSFFLLGASNSRLTDIETAIMREDYAQVEQLSQQFLKTKPSKAEFDQGLYYLGLSQIQLMRYKEARDTFQLLISGFPKERMRDQAYLGFIDALLLDQQYDGALKVAEEFLSKNPKSEYLSLIYLKLARAHLKLTHWKEAKEYLEKITEGFPQSLEAKIAKQLLEEKQYFAVQVGAFLDKTRADHLAKELKQKNEYAYIVETVDPKGQKFYRVRVGKLSLLEEAQNLRLRLAQLGYPTQIYP